VRSTRSVVVASMPRTGSTLLCSALERTGLVGVPLEYLLPRFLESGHRVLGAPHPTQREQRRLLFRRLRLQREWWGYREIEPASLPAYIAGLVSRRSSANGVFGLKVFWNHFQDAQAMGFHPSQLPQPVTWIHLDRRDRIAQSVSLVKASQSGTFAMREPARPAAERTHYDDGALLRAWQGLRDGTSEWNGYFKAHRITPIRVWYEDLASDYEGTITGLLEALGFQDVKVPPPIHRRQADAVNAQWIAAFRRNHPELTHLGPSGDEHPGQP
jgi:LPS sulfotransferase NodH